MKQLEQQVLDIFTNVSCFRQRRCVADRKGNVQRARQGAGEQCFARSGWSGEQNIRLLDLDIGSFPVERKSLVVIVYCDREYSFGRALTDYILIKIRNDFARTGNLVEELLGFASATLFVVENVVAEVDALATDVDIARTFHQRSDVTVAFSTE